MRCVAVVGGGDVDAAVETEAEAFGRGVAERGWVLVNGGRAAGVMGASARGAKAAGGLTVGILKNAQPQEGSPGEHIDVAIFTGLGDARNVVNVLTGEVVVAFAGGAGTLSEVALALKSRRPVVLVGWQRLDAFEPWATRGQLVRVADAKAALAAVEPLLARSEAQPTLDR